MQTINLITLNLLQLQIKFDVQSTSFTLRVNIIYVPVYTRTHIK